jgi:uncharacterized membrane protein
VRFWSALNRRRTALIDGLRSGLWPVPLIGAVCAVAAGVLLPELDRLLDGRLPGEVSDYLFGGGPAAAREVLSAIAASLMTVTSLTFSLTVVTLQLASAQYSPRLLRTFAQDKFVQRTLALFIATFVYSVTVLRTVRDARDSSSAFVPQVSVTVGYLLALLSVLGLVLFLAHLVRQIRVETMVNTVRADAAGTADAVLGGESGEHAPLPTPPAHAVSINARHTGFVVGVDEGKLVDAAAKVDAVVLVDRAPGDWLVAGTPVALVWSAAGKPLSDDDLKTVHDCVAAAVHTGDERIPVQDLGYGLRQLADVAIKALSPGINDPTTAVHVLGHMSALLCDLADRQPGPTIYRDENSAALVAVRRPDLADLLDLAVSQPRRYGAADASVLSGLLRLLRELAWCSNLPAHREAVAAQLRRARRTVSRQDFDDTERDDLERLALAVEDALTGRWRTPL